MAGFQQNGQGDDEKDSVFAGHWVRHYRSLRILQTPIKNLPATEVFALHQEHFLYNNPRHAE
jgi:hypothetical protein